ncbi:hypothetical protein HCN60_13360 [Escherichia coli]|nr:hypothetical protein [Escherichia coli]MBJ0260016.1 hypothetical protein [Escherichia coli]NMQ81525.1 hypothetical protein [Escherichia coli]
MDHYCTVRDTMGHTGRRSMPRYYIQPGRKMRPSKERFASKLSQIPPLRHTREEVDMVVAGQQSSWIDCCITQPR